MLDNNTEKNLNNVIPKDYKNRYRAIMDGCSDYMVKHNGNKHWLCGTKILTEWKHCLHSNPFESWNFPTEAIARESFYERNFNEEW